MTTLRGCGRKISHGTLSGSIRVWLDIISLQQSIGVRSVPRTPHTTFRTVEVLTRLIIGPSWSWAALDFGSAWTEDLLILEEGDNRVRSLVLIQNAHVEPLGPSEFGLLKGGYLEMKGRVGPISPATNLRNAGEQINGHWPFECVVDVVRPGTVIEDEPLFCLPLLLRSMRYRRNPAVPVAECLLLQQVSPDKQGYTRVGLLSVSLTLAYALPEGLRWIVEFADSELPLENEATVTLY